MKIKKSVLREFIAQVVREVILREQQTGAIPAGGKVSPPPVPRQVAATSRLQSMTHGPININNVLQKRKMGQPLNAQEKRAYLDYVAQQNTTAQAQAKVGQGAQETETGLSAMEKNPERYMKN